MSSKSLKLGLVGYGRMGKEVEAIMLERGHQVLVRVDEKPMPGVSNELNVSLIKDLDGIIEFSLPHGIVKNASVYGEAKVNVVVGTTGWEKEKAQVQAIVESSQIGYLYGSNFSVGAHLFFKLAGQIARFIDGLPEYDIMLHEYHHKLKADSPSGTALTAAKSILAHSSRKTVIQTQALDRPIEDHELHVSSTRGGSIPGIHTVTVDSLADTIEITHNARSRRGFALGSVLAMEWMIGKKGFFDVQAFIDDVLSL